METTKQTISSISWQKAPQVQHQELFTADKLIDAYFKGVKEGFEQQQQMMFAQLEKNIEQSTQNTSIVINKIKELGLKTVNAFLRIETVFQFEVLITLGKNDMLKQEVLELYSFMAQYERVVKSDLYEITFSLMDSSKHIDEDLIISDGYFLKSKLLNEKSSR